MSLSVILWNNLPCGFVSCFLMIILGLCLMGMATSGGWASSVHRVGVPGVGTCKACIVSDETFITWLRWYLWLLRYKLTIFPLELLTIWEQGRYFETLHVSWSCLIFHPPSLASIDGSCLWQLLMWFSISLLLSTCITWNSSIGKSSISFSFIYSCMDSRICIFVSEFNAIVIYFVAQLLPTWAIGSFTGWTPVPF